MTPTSAVAAALEGIAGPVGAAVSGGGDSIALLVASIEAGADLRVATVDHGLRPESTAEAAEVARFCAARGVEHDTLTWRWDGAGNLPAMARQGRLDALAAWAEAQGLAAVLLGHTQDDVAETFLMRLSRRAGVDGLSAMAPAFRHRGAIFLRPLLNQSRAGLRDFLRGRRIAWIDDPTNDDPAFERTRARQALAALGPLGIDAACLSDVAAQMGEARAALDVSLLGLVDRTVQQVSGDLLVSAAVFEAPEELVRRLHAAAFRWIGQLPYPPRRAELARVLAAARAGRSATLAGVHMIPQPEGVLLTREFAAVQDVVTATTSVWDGRWRLDGPHAAGMTVRALGPEGLASCPDWRGTGRARVALLSTPGVWTGSELVAAPEAGFGNGWLVDVAVFRDQLASLSRGN